MTPDGNIGTVAGNGVQTYAGDGGPATSASLDGPLAVAVDASGNLYIADANNNAIREVTADGLIHTVVGTGIPGSAGDGGPPSAAQVTAPAGLAFDSAGNLYVSDSTMRIRKIVPGTIVLTIAGTGTSGYSGDAGIAALADLNGPSGVAVDPSGNVYFADSLNDAVRLLQPAASTLTLSAVTNAATNQSGAVAPGEIVVLYGSGIGPAQLTVNIPGPDEKLPTALAGTTVTFNGIAAPLLYTSPTQVSAVVPFGVSGSSVSVSISYFNQPTTALTSAVASAAPGLFTADYSGKGQAVAMNQDQSINGAANPATRGSQLTVFATGLGQTTPTGTDGLLGGAPLPTPAVQPTVTIGGQPATLVSATGVAYQVAGMMQITVQVPSGIQPGNALPVTVQVGNISAPAGVTVAVQ